MREDLRKNASHHVHLASVLLFGPAIAAMLLSYSAFTHFLAPYGLDLWTKFVAAVTAAVIAIIYWLSFSILIGVVAFLPRQDRAKIMPVVWVMIAFILAASAYPNVEFMAGGYANDFEDKAYVEMVVGRAEEKAAQIEKLGGQLEPVMNDLRDWLRVKARGERGGETSGVPTNGPVAIWIESYAERAEGMATAIREGKDRAAAVKPRIKAAADIMRAAVNNPASDPASRRVAMQSAAGELRAAAIELSQTVPLSSLGNFADSLKGEQVRPALGAKEVATRARQQAALLSMEAGLKARGEQIEKTLRALSNGDEALIPPYMPAPTPILVVKHALKLLNVIAAALAIDLLPLAIFLIIARVNDAIRRVPEDAVRSLSVGELIDAEKAKAMLRVEQARREQGLIEKSPKTRWLDKDDDGRDAR